MITGFRLSSMILFMLLSIHQNALTQDAGVDPLTSYQRASKNLMAGIQAMGGLPKLLSLQNMRMEVTGHATEQAQSHDSRTSPEPKPVSLTCTYDFTKGQLHCDIQREYLGGILFDVDFVFQLPLQRASHLPGLSKPPADLTRNAWQSLRPEYQERN